MNKTVLVALGFRARNGKDTAAKAIIDNFADKYDVRHYSFGMALKEEVNGIDQVEWCMRHGIAYDFDPPMDDPLCQTKHGKQSRLLQFYGTEYRRAQDRFYWINKLHDRLEVEKPQFAVISDLRFLDEFYWVKSGKGYTVKVNRHGFVDLSRDSKHVSETQLDNVGNWDYEIGVLDGELEQLKQDACEVFQMIVEAQTPVTLEIAA